MNDNGTPTPTTIRSRPPHVRRYLGKTITITFGSGQERTGKLLEVDPSGIWGRLDQSAGAAGGPVVSVNLRRAEVIG